MRRWLMALSLVLACPLARAAEQGFYFGLGVNRSEFGDVAGALYGAPYLDETGWKAIAGVRPFKFLAAEVAYMNLGTENGPGVGARSETTARSA